MTTQQHAGIKLTGTSIERAAYSTASLPAGSIWVQTSGGAGDPTVYIWTGSAWAAIGGGGATHNILSATHADSSAAAAVEGDVIVANATPAWVRKARGTTHQLFKMDATGTAPEWDSFDWDDMAASAGADMAHTHASAGEGGQLDWDNVWADAAHDHSVAGEGGQFSQLLGPQFSDATSSAVTAGDLIYGNATPAWDDLAIGTAQQLLRVNAGATAPEWASFDWDNVSSAAASDMVHSHESAAEGGVLLVNGATITVGVGKDYATIQEAIDYLKNKILYGNTTIAVDAGNYDEAVSFESILLSPGATLTLQGDSRALAGMSFVDGAAMNPEAIANGGSGVCTLVSSTTTEANDTITVTGAGGNPDYDADGWGAGDKILTYDNLGNILDYTILSATNNVILLNAPGPQLGNDATAICLLPNRAINRSTAGPCVDISAIRGIYIDGFYLESSTGTDCHGVRVINGALVICSNCASYAEDRNFFANGRWSQLEAQDGSCTAWSGQAGYMATSNASIFCDSSVAIGATYGYWSNVFANIVCSDAVSVNATSDGYRCVYLANMFMNEGTARQCTTNGYYAAYNAMLNAGGTNNNNNGNGTNYNPAPSVPGSAEGNHYGVIYATA